MAVFDRNRWRSTDMYIFATVGEKAAPIGMPVVCLKMALPNSK